MVRFSTSARLWLNSGTSNELMASMRDVHLDDLLSVFSGGHVEVAQRLADNALLLANLTRPLSV